jgi:hypothetical protein
MKRLRSRSRAKAGDRESAYRLLTKAEVNPSSNFVPALSATRVTARHQLSRN